MDEERRTGYVEFHKKLDDMAVDIKIILTVLHGDIAQGTPGLVQQYAGHEKQIKKWRDMHGLVLNTILVAFITACIGFIVWKVVGYPPTH